MESSTELNKKRNASFTKPEAKVAAADAEAGVPVNIPESQGDVADQAEREIEVEMKIRLDQIRRAARQSNLSQ